MSLFWLVQLTHRGSTSYQIDFKVYLHMTTKFSCLDLIVGDSFSRPRVGVQGSPFELMYQVVLCGYHNWHFETFYTPDWHDICCLTHFWTFYKAARLQDDASWHPLTWFLWRDLSALPRSHADPDPTGPWCSSYGRGGYGWWHRAGMPSYQANSMEIKLWQEALPFAVENHWKNIWTQTPLPWLVLT